MDSNLNRQQILDRVAELSVVEMALLWEKQKPDSVFLRQPKGDQWHEYTFGEVFRKARTIAAKLQSLNLPEKSNIGLLSRNCADWIITDLGIMFSGHVSVPFYANLNSESLSQVLEHSECQILFIGKILDEDWENMKDGIPDGLVTVTLPDYPIEGIQPMNDFLESTEPLQQVHIPKLDELATIIYTSGTTGNPKGVMHTYATMAAAVNAAKYLAGIHIDNPRFVSYLPLCHVAERSVIECGSLYCGGTISFVESLDTFAKNVQEARVTHFFGVPRIWEKMQQKVSEKLPQKKLNTLLSIPIVNSLIKKKIRTAIGLDKAKYLFSGAAPITPWLLNWYAKIGISIQEAYGMTENFSASTINPKEDTRPGFVGKFYDGMEYKILEGSGELILKAPWTFPGYYKEPALTDDTVIDGWLHTGDIGEVDADGYLKITGRVKEIFKTSKGKYISPAPEEIKILAHDDVDQACMMGIGFPQPFVLLVLSEEGRKKTQEKLSQYFEDLLEETNKRLVDYQRIHKFIIVPEEWSAENGLLTPTLKLKRNNIREYYETQFEDWYQSNTSVVWA